MPMNTMLTRCSGGSTPCSRSTAAICPTISPASRLRLTPSNAVKQNLQFTAHPTWLDTQIVARRELMCGDGAEPALSGAEGPRPAGRSPAATRSASLPASISSPASLPSPLSPPSPSGIQTVSTVSPSASFAKYHHALLHRPWREEHILDFSLDYLPPYSPDLNPI